MRTITLIVSLVLAVTTRLVLGLLLLQQLLQFLLNVAGHRRVADIRVDLAASSDADRDRETVARELSGEGSNS